MNKPDDDKKDYAKLARIDLDEAPQVIFWCNHLRCSESQLRDAVQRVGSSVARVQAFLD